MTKQILKKDKVHFKVICCNAFLYLTERMHFVYNNKMRSFQCFTFIYFGT